MKKLFASIAALFVAASVTTASAQAIMNDDSNPWRFGVQLGLNMPTFGESEYSSTIGWNMGATVLYDMQHFIPNTYLRGSVLYSRKGSAAGELTITNDKDIYHFKDATYYLHYLDVPLHFGYAYELNDMFCLFAETGPYLAFRFSGSQRYDVHEKWNPTTSKFEKWEQCPDDMADNPGMGDLRRFDIGWGVGAGILIDKKYQLSANYDWGMCDAVPDVTGKNLNFSINLAVFFD